MRTLPAGLAASLASGATTLARCWRLERSDGTVLGFTDHDRDLTFDTVTYAAATGMTASGLDQSSGLNVDTVDIVGALQSAALNEDDLANGLYDNAGLTIYLVDWTNVADRIVLFAGSVGEVARGRTAFRAEMRSLAHALNQERGRLYQRTCDADLGDARCGIDLDAPDFKGEGVVTAIGSDRSIVASGLDGYASGWFTRGRLTWASGGNSGAVMEVKSHAKSASTVSIDLWERMATPIEIGDEFEVTAGCDKAFATCKAKFANVENFRGFPHIPGNDVLASYPNTGDDNDGGSLFGN